MALDFGVPGLIALLTVYAVGLSGLLLIPFISL